MADVVFKRYSAFYKYKKQYYVALDKIDFTVPDGQITVAVGPSGCGKTTLLKSIAGLIELTEGELLVGGENVENVSPKSRSMAYVAQEYSLYPQMTVFENIAFPLKMMNVSFSELNERVRNIAAELKIDWLLTRKPKQLSGGQQQRVAIARALVKNPRLLLFDEPFANLEHSLRLEMQQLIKGIHAKQKQTIVFVTHDLPEAFFLADRMVVMKDGCIEQIGTPQEIESAPKSELVKEFLRK